MKQLGTYFSSSVTCIPDTIDGIGAVLVEVTAGVGVEVTAPL